MTENNRPLFLERRALWRWILATALAGTLPVIEGCSSIAGNASSPATSSASVADPTIEAVRRALLAKYPRKTAWTSGDLLFETDKPVSEMALSALRKNLPDVRFYKATLETGYYEYRDLTIAVAVQEGKPIATYLSPTYGSSEPEFVTRFVGAKASTTEDRLAVAGDIAAIFAAITYKGTIRAPKLDGDTFTAELWHGDLQWREIAVTFSGGAVSSVRVGEGRSFVARADR